MAAKRTPNRWIVLPKWLFACFAILACIQVATYRPDRPVANIAPASSSEPKFVIQVIRPRLGLPLGGILPPKFFGADGHLGFSSASNAAKMVSVDATRIKFSAEDWEFLLVFDANGKATAETEIVFNLLFEDKVRRVRCRPRQSPVATVNLVKLSSGERAGTFDIELPHCEDAKTGVPLGWPPRPLILHGSFDRLVIGPR